MNYLNFNISNNFYVFLIALFLLSWRPFILQSETLKMYTYYPAPYAGYDKLLTNGDTYLARSGSSSVYWGSGDSRLSNDNGGSIYLVGTSDSSMPFIQFKAGSNASKLYIKSPNVLAVDGDFQVEGFIRNLCKIQGYVDKTGTNDRTPTYCGDPAGLGRNYIIVSERSMETWKSGTNTGVHILKPSGEMVCCRIEAVK